MKKAISYLRALDKLGVLLAYLSSAGIAAMIAITVYEVVARKVFSAPTLWSNTSSYMLSGTIFLFGAAYTLRADRHVKIDFMLTVMPLRIQHLISFLFYAVIFFPALCLICDVAMTKTLKAYDRGTLEAMSAWRPVIWPFMAGMALGLASLTLQVFIEMLRHLLVIISPVDVDKILDTFDQQQNSHG